MVDIYDGEKRPDVVQHCYLITLGTQILVANKTNSLGFYEYLTSYLRSVY